MPDGQVLEFTRVTKRFNEVAAVSDFSARVEPGLVTAFLGPNGAGKTTTLRILLGQLRATAGTAMIGGVPYADLRQPLRTIGAVLEETPYRPRRTANRQLALAAKANGIPLSRIDEVLSLVGLEGEGDTRIGGYSLGMRQRLSVATALLGDPGALVFDEPANGLDPEGIRWMRLLMRRLADEGRTVLVSSHVLSEVEQVADHVLVLSKGQLVLSSGIETLADPAGGSVVVDADDRSALTAALAEAGFDIEVLRSGLTVRGGDAPTVGAIAASAGIALSTLVQRGPTLEDVFIDLIRGRKFTPRSDPEGAAQEDVRGDADLDADAGADAGVDATEGDSAGAAESEDAASVDVADADEASAHVSEGAPAVTAEGDDGLSADEIADGDAAPVEDVVPPAPRPENGERDDDATAAPSFDEILFGTAEPVAAAAPSVFPPFGAADEQFAATASAGDSVDQDTGDDDSLGAQADGDDHSGIEIFEALGASEDASSGEERPAERPAEEQGGEESSEQFEEIADVDPRSVAVSSMLAAAARAYFEEEPKDYPLSDQGVEHSADTASEGDAPAGTNDEHEHHAGGEHHEDREGDEGEQHHREGEHHGGEQHHHEGEHHGGEQQHEGEHHWH